VVKAVNGVSYDVSAGETVGIIGESGCGKTAGALALLRLLPQAGKVVAGEAALEGRDLLKLSSRELRSVRGREIGMVFQDPMTSLHPLFPVGTQLAEAIRTHDRSLPEDRARSRAVELLETVEIPEAARRMNDYPHEWSGGMRQRAMIAMAIANSPKLLIADEPTTALDVTVQAQVLKVLRAARRDTGAAIILISHDLGVMAEMADRVLVMYAGSIVESADVATLFRRPLHPYTSALLASVPRPDMDRGELLAIPGQPPNLLRVPSGCPFHPRCHLRKGRLRCVEEVPPLAAADHLVACHFSHEMAGEAANAGRPAAVTRKVDLRPREILRVEGLVKHYVSRGGDRIRAVDGVSFSLAEGETLALVGESGCGKSTVARAILRLRDPIGGRIYIGGRDITHSKGPELRALRRNLQIVFQDPYASLNPKKRVAEIILEPMLVHRLLGRRDGIDRVHELLSLVGLDAEHANRFPHQLSSGQRQRVGIARALALEPQVLVLDEPVSALDVSIQAQIINVLQNLQDRLGIAYLLIAHNLAVVRQLADRVAVMYLGKIVEIADRRQIYENPTHPYTQALLSVAPIPDPSRPGLDDRIVLTGDVPSAADPPSGCRFRTRCWKAQSLCAESEPELEDRFAHGHPAACFFADPSPVDYNAETSTVRES
jgi:peptide/nickel transport system ATP-binding protein